MLKKVQQGRRVRASGETTEDRRQIPQRCFLEPLMLNGPSRQLSSNEAALRARTGLHVQHKDPQGQSRLRYQKLSAKTNKVPRIVILEASHGVRKNN